MNKVSNRIDNLRRDRKNKKILTDNLKVGDIFKLKHELNLSNEKICELFDI